MNIYRVTSKCLSLKETRINKPNRYLILGVRILALFLSLICLPDSIKAQVKQVKKVKEKTTTISDGVVIVGSSPTVSMTLDGHTFSGTLPFDEPFQITCTPDAADAATFDDITGIECWFDVKGNWPDLEKVKQAPQDFLKWHITGTIDKKGKRFLLSIPELDPNRNYFFVFVIKRVLSSGDKAALVTKLKDELSSAVSKASKNGDKEISDAQFKTLLNNTLQLSKKALAGRGINVRFEELTADQLKTMLTALQNISSGYKTASTYRESVVDAVKNVNEWGNRLRNFEAQFEAKSANPAADPKVMALKAIFPLIPSVLQFPDGIANLTTPKCDAYIIACQSLKAAVKLIRDTQITGDGDFNKLYSDIEAYTTGLLTKFPRFVSEMQGIQSTNDIETQNFIESQADVLYSTSYVVGTSTPGDFVTRSNFYISADLGVAVIPELGLMAPYLGTNIYLRPVNKKHPLTRWQLDERFSFLIGLSVTSLSKTGVRTDLLGSNFNLITGAGLRVADFVRINGGAIWYGQRAANPLNSQQKIGASFFASLSFDIDVKTVFSALFDTNKITLIK